MNRLPSWYFAGMHPRDRVIVDEILSKEDPTHEDVVEIIELAQGWFDEEVSAVQDEAGQDGYDKGYDEGWIDGHSEGYGEGHSDGYEEGYEEGHEDGHFAGKHGS